MLQRLPHALEARSVARCVRCGATLKEAERLSLSSMVAILLACTMLFVLANTYPVLILEVAGKRSAATLWQTVIALQGQGMLEVALLVLFTSIVMPALALCSMLYVQLLLWRAKVPPGFASMLRLYGVARPWCMVEVFLVGVLISLVKLVHLANVHPGIGLWALFALIMLQAACMGGFSPSRLWERISHAPLRSV
ncbi:paraquat-inducible protein A [Chromobacterium sp. ASV23]|uniref:paraquat-inducible protein A n=1 Tax=Chromobacterium sp. ASV23 TaxID=2795110 RepID=UPI0018EDD2CE|nr:paraquat-inducible protein A [Chromobacterium sp. ASV23]